MLKLTSSQKALVEAKTWQHVQLQINQHLSQIGGVKRGGRILTLHTAYGIQTPQAVFARKKVITNWICQGKRD